MKMYETEWLSYHEHWRAMSHLDAARRAYAHAAEIGHRLPRVSVSAMTEPEGDGGGLVYVVNDTRTYERLGNKVCRQRRPRE